MAGVAAGEPAPNDEGALVRGVLDAIAADHPAADELVSYSREGLVRVEAFCREHEVIGLVDEPLDIDWTPEFMRSFGGAMLDSPGPLDRARRRSSRSRRCPRTGRPSSPSRTCAR